MTNTANHAVPEPGRFARALAAVWGVLQAMDSTNFDYSLDRIERLEREVERLQEELRQSQDYRASKLTAPPRQHVDPTQMDMD